MLLVRVGPLLPTALGLLGKELESELREAPRETLGGVADSGTNARNVIFVVLALSHPQMVRTAPDGTVWNVPVRLFLTYPG